MRISLLAVAAALGLGLSTGNASSQAAVPVDAPGAGLEASTRLNPLPRNEAARSLPIVLQARSLRSQPDLDTVAEGDVEFRRGGLVILSDLLAYDTPSDRAKAKGHVRVRRDGAVYSGPNLR